MMKRNACIVLFVSAFVAFVWLVTGWEEQIVELTESGQDSIAPEILEPDVHAETEVVEKEGSDGVSAASEASLRAPAHESAPPTRIERFLEPRAKIVFLESYVRERLSEEDLPGLYAALKNENYARQWNTVILAICILEEDRKALEFVRSFAATPWDWQASGREGQDARLVIRGIVNTVVNLALLDPAISGPFLEEIFTRDGAERFLEKWDAYIYPEGATLELLVNDLMFSAASGLIHTRVPEYNRLVEDKARELHAISKEDRTDEEATLLFNCCQLLGWRMIYEEMGWDDGIKYINTLDYERAIDLSMQSVGRYIIYLNERADGLP